jgi:signal transduction histidine kinase
MSGTSAVGGGDSSAVDAAASNGAATASRHPAAGSTGARAGWWGYILAWLPILTLYTTVFVSSGFAVGFAIRGAFANVVPDALLGMGVLQLPRWLRWPERKKARFFATHAAVLLVFTFASSALWAGLLRLDWGIFRGNWRATIDLRLLPFRVLNDLLFYASLVGLGYARANAAAGRELAARAARAEMLRARAELETLRSQLNPHFILNTFHALIGLVRRDPATAEQALEQLGDLLRYSLRIQREGRDEVPLRDEWRFVRSYLDLESLRLGDRLSVTFDADDVTLDCPVPAFSLQTLVENAIHHAIAPRAAGGRLTVSARRVADRLRVRVEDDGPGEAAPPTSRHGVGLALLRERLAALHGGRARLELESARGGSAAVLDLPAPAGDDE